MKKILIAWALAVAASVLILVYVYNQQHEPRLLAPGHVPKFEDYHVVAFIAQGGQHVAMIEEFFVLIGAGATDEEALADLRRKFDDRVKQMTAANEPFPQPGAGPPPVKLASTREIEALGPLVDDFFENVLEYRSKTRFVSDESSFSEWAENSPGGRDGALRRVKERYGVDVSPSEGEPLWKVLKRIADERGRKR